LELAPAGLARNKVSTMQNQTSASSNASRHTASPAAQPIALTKNVAAALPAALSAQFALNLLHAMLNQVDYGLAAVNAKTRALVLANAPGYAALQAGTQPSIGLMLQDGLVCTCLTAHAAQFEAALARTASHQRDLLRLAAGKDACTVAVLPLLTGLPFGMGAPLVASNHGGGDAGADQFSLLVFSKQTLCDATSVALFARERGLTIAESQVLAQLCAGLRPQQIALRQGLQVSTVRSHLRAIRVKTTCDTVRELVERISVLPPTAHHWPSGFGQGAGAQLGYA
jgi:DNA-binding CsgD family transcriptional regulator